MINKILPILGISKIVPEDLVKKGLEKINPKFRKVFGEAEKYGYPAGAVLGFLRSEMGGGSQEPVNPQERPDISANKELKRQSQLPQRLAGAVGNVAGGAALGGLSGAALGGLSSVMSNPESSQQSPEQVQPQTKPQPQSPEQQKPGGFQTFLDKHPELGRFLDMLIGKGMEPKQAALEAKKQSKLIPMIQDIESNIGQSLEDLMGQLFQGTDKFKGSGKQQSQGKTEFLQGLDQLSQMIQGLKGR